MKKGKLSKAQAGKLNTISRRTAEILFEIDALSIDTEHLFRLSSGILSPMYCDVRLLMSYPKKLRKIIKFMSDLVKVNSLKFDVVGGVAASGIHLAALLSQRMHKPMIYVRQMEKYYGKMKRIEGRLMPEQSVLVVEDVITTGKSVQNAVYEIHKHGNDAAACVSIFTYNLHEPLGRLSDLDCRILALTDLDALIEVGVEKKKITGEQAEMLSKWRNDLMKKGR